MAVVVLNVVKEFLLQIFFARKASSPQEVPGEEGKPDLNLVKPGGMKGKKMKDDAFVGLLKNALLFLLRHFLPIQAAQFGHKLSHFLRQMRFEVVHNQVNLPPGMFFHNPFQELTEFSGPVALRKLPRYLARMGVESSKQSHRPMPDVTKLSESGLPRKHQLVREKPLKGLHPRFLIDTEHHAPGRRFQVKSDDPKHLLLKEGVRGVEPVAPSPGFNRGLFEPSVNRRRADRFHDPLFEGRPAKLPETPGLEGPTHLAWRLQDQLNQPVLLTRGKRRSELRYAEGLSGPSIGLSKSASATSERYFLQSQDAGQFGRWPRLGLREELSWPLDPLAERASWSASLFQGTSFLQSSTRSGLAEVLSLRPPRFLNLEDRQKPLTNLRNSVLDSAPSDAGLEPGKGRIRFQKKSGRCRN